MQCFGGKNVRYELKSKELDCTTTFTVYYPPAAESGKVPVRRWLLCQLTLPVWHRLVCTQCSPPRQGQWCADNLLPCRADLRRRELYQQGWRTGVPSAATALVILHLLPVCAKLMHSAREL